jgi:hypothetical protein
MFALIKDGALNQYPYNFAQLKVAHPNVSFPATPSDETLQEFGMFRVFNATQPELTDTQVLEEDSPVFSTENQRWTQVWRVRDMTAEEVTSRNDVQAAQVRTDRNTLLSASDWTQIADAPVDKAVWATYRQSLRDIPTQSGFPWEVTWPTQSE